MKKNNLCIWGLIMIFACGVAYGKSNAVCSKQDEMYLREILQQTWTYLDTHLAKETGFPTDSQKPGGMFMLDRELGQRVFTPPPAEGE